MRKRSILAVEDDAAIGRGIVDALRYSGYRALLAPSLREARELFRTDLFDLVLLDVVLPDGTGLDLLAEIRDASPRQPVIVLTARGEERDRVAGLKRGADDYVVKPFSLDELLARVEAVLRRAPPATTEQPRLDLGAHGVVDLSLSQLTRPTGERVELSLREVQLVDYLARNTGRVVTRDELLQNVWGIDARGVTTRTIDMHVARLREKLNDDAAQPQVLVTVRGRGYRWRTAGE